MSKAQVKDADGQADRGLRCWRCGNGQFRVIYTRPARDSKLVRRRECLKCGARATTWERMIGIA